MYKDKIKVTEEELNKVQTSLREHQQLEQRLLGRLITLNELQAEADELADKPKEEVAS